MVVVKQSVNEKSKMNRTWKQKAQILYEGHRLLRAATIAGRALDDRIACGHFDIGLHGEFFAVAVLKKRNIDVKILQQWTM